MDNVEQQAAYSAWELGYDDRKAGSNVNRFNKNIESDLYNAWRDGWYTADDELTWYAKD